MSAPGIRLAHPDDADALAALWAEAFTPPLTPGQWLLDPRRFDTTFVAVDEHGVCGSIYGVRRRLREDDGGIAEVHGIGSVAVAERARGRGLARRLVTTTLDAAGDADWALLFTGTPDVYASNGFVSFTMDRTIGGPWRPVGTVVSEGADAVDAHRVAPGALAGVRRCYEDSRDRGVALAPARGEIEWRMAEERLRGTTCT